MQRAAGGLGRLRSRLLPPPVTLLGLMLDGFGTAVGIFTVARLGIADQLKDGPRSVEEIAAATGCDAGALRRLLRMLTPSGIFAERRDGRFAMTRLARPLCAGEPDSVRDWAVFMGAAWHWPMWNDVAESVRTGRTAIELKTGTGFFEWVGADLEHAGVFDSAMTCMSTITDPAIVAASDLTGVGTLVDVAGGQGALLAALLVANPTMRGILFDQPAVIERAGAGGPLQRAGVMSRCELVAGSFFESVPGGADAYLMKWIIHDWEESKAQRILGVCRDAMRPGRRLLLVESVIVPGNAPDPGRIIDVAMLVLTGGRERTREDFARLLARCGFSLRQVRPTSSPFSIVEAVAV
jgi:O-methyltransferase domain